MDKQKTIICHSFPAWDTPYVKSTVELMTRLTKECRVIFIDYHYTWKDVLRNKFTPINQVLGLTSRWRNIEGKNGILQVYNFAPILPINWIKNPKLFKAAAKMNGRWLNWQIKRFVKKHSLEDSVLVNAFNPIYGSMTIDAWQAQKSVYYCYDEISGTEWSGKHGETYEKEFLQIVDQVVVTSPELKKNKSTLNNNIDLVPNGVNLDIFNQSKEKTASGISIGYVGAIDNRIDFKLINSLAQTYPDYSFDFYGPLKVDESNFEHKNIHLHGAIPQTELPSKIAEMDVCIIPFVKNELTASIYPLKANEYLAMGKSVISTDFADLSDFESIISVKSSDIKFSEQITTELANNSSQIVQARIDFAKNNSWDNRSKQFCKAIAA